MIVYSGKEAVNLLGVSHRIWQDINSAIDSTIGEFSMFVCVRQWAQIHPSMEFRGFVYKNKLTAMSSYNRCVCWDGILEKKEEILKSCVSYWEKIKTDIPKEMDSFVIDFAILEDTGEVTIVEFNDFADFEGAASNAELFNWVIDREVLTGEKPFEFRIVEKAVNERPARKDNHQTLQDSFGMG